MFDWLEKMLKRVKLTHLLLQRWSGLKGPSYGFHPPWSKKSYVLSGGYVFWVCVCFFLFFRWRTSPNWKLMIDFIEIGKWKFTCLMLNVVEHARNRRPELECTLNSFVSVLVYIIPRKHLVFDIFLFMFRVFYMIKVLFRVLAFPINAWQQNE